MKTCDCHGSAKGSSERPWLSYTQVTSVKWRFSLQWSRFIVKLTCLLTYLHHWLAVYGSLTFSGGIVVVGVRLFILLIIQFLVLVLPFIRSSSPEDDESEGSDGPWRRFLVLCFFVISVSWGWRVWELNQYKLYWYGELGFRVMASFAVFSSGRYLVFIIVVLFLAPFRRFITSCWYRRFFVEAVFRFIVTSIVCP